MPFFREFSCIAGALPFAAQARAWAAIIAAREARQTAAGATGRKAVLEERPDCTGQRRS